MAPVAAGPLNGGNTTATSVMLDRAENLLHKNFGQYQFWSARRSMRFSPELRKFANEYREKHFNSGKKSKFLSVPRDSILDDKSDKTDIWGQNWDEVKTELGDAIGGNYLGVHLRRKDFLYARKEEVPSLSDAISQIKDRFSIPIRQIEVILSVILVKSRLFSSKTQ